MLFKNMYKKYIFYILMLVAFHSKAQVSADFTAEATTVCTNTPLIFTFIGSGNITSYKWSFGINAFPDSAFTRGPQTVSFATAGPQNVSLTVSDGVSTDTKTMIIDVSNPVNPVFSVSGPVNTIPTFINFNLTNASGGASYSWAFGDPVSGFDNGSTGQAPTHKYIYGGTYIPCVTADNSGCKTTYCSSITITAGSSGRKANFSISPAGSTCVGNTVSIKDASSNMGSDTRNWDFGVGATPPSYVGLTPPLVSWNSPGKKVITLTVKSGTNDNNIKVKGITYNVYAYPVADFNFTGNTCSVPASLNFIAASASGNSYAWNFGDGTGSASSAPTKIFNTAGTYNVTLYTTRNSCTSFLTRQIVVGAGCNPVVQAGMTISPSENACLQQKYIFNDSSIGNVSPSGQSWSFGAGASPSSATGAGPHTVTYSSEGPHTVTHTVNGSQTVTTTIQ